MTEPTWVVRYGGADAVEEMDDRIRQLQRQVAHANDSRDRWRRSAYLANVANIIWVLVWVLF